MLLKRVCSSNAGCGATTTGSNVIILTVVTCLLCDEWWNTNPRTEMLVWFATMADCRHLQNRWISDPDTRIIGYCRETN